jgi:two-component sensor histidine kinase
VPRIDIPPSAASIASVRHALADDLERVGTGDSVADATLVLSELLSNAVRHAAPLAGNGLVVNWHVEDGAAMVVIAVTDGATEAEPVVQQPSVAADSGRGLAIVDKLASAWGVRRSLHHKTVWARVPLRHRLAHLQ